MSRASTLIVCYTLFASFKASRFAFKLFSLETGAPLMHNLKNLKFKPLFPRIQFNRWTINESEIESYLSILSSCRFIRVACRRSLVKHHGWLSKLLPTLTYSVPSRKTYRLREIQYVTFQIFPSISFCVFPACPFPFPLDTFDSTRSEKSDSGSYLHRNESFSVYKSIRAF